MFPGARLANAGDVVSRQPPVGEIILKADNNFPKPGALLSRFLGLAQALSDLFIHVAA